MYCGWQNPWIATHPKVTGGEKHSFSSPVTAREALVRRSAYVYLLQCADGTIYTGWTFNVAARVAMHQRGRGARYTRSRRPLILLYSERVASRRVAMRREAEIKRWPRARKLKLANS